MRKTLEDFKKWDGTYDYQAYANYLESAECSNDDEYDILVDVPSGNIYERKDGDWKKGHGHQNVFNGYDRDKNDKSSEGRPWKNPWLKYAEQLNLTSQEIEFLNTLYICKQTNELENTKSLSKTI